MVLRVVWPSELVDVGRLARLAPGAHEDDRREQDRGQGRDSARTRRMNHWPIALRSGQGCAWRRRAGGRSGSAEPTTSRTPPAPSNHGHRWALRCPPAWRGAPRPAARRPTGGGRAGARRTGGTGGSPASGRGRRFTWNGPENRCGFVKSFWFEKKPSTHWCSASSHTSRSEHRGRSDRAGQRWCSP